MPYDYLAPFHGAPEKWLPVVRDDPAEGPRASSNEIFTVFLHLDNIRRFRRRDAALEITAQQR